jgi:hypothetical protein
MYMDQEHIATFDNLQVQMGKMGTDKENEMA